jgi:hypothetical protein
MNNQAGHLETVLSLQTVNVIPDMSNLRLFFLLLFLQSCTIHLHVAVKEEKPAPAFPFGGSITPNYGTLVWPESYNGADIGGLQPDHIVDTNDMVLRWHGAGTWRIGVDSAGRIMSVDTTGN